MQCVDCKEPFQPGVPYVISEAGNLCQGCAEKRQPICEVCQERVSGQVIMANDKKYHPECFVCECCQSPITSNFTLSGEGGIVCLSCNEKMLPKCAGCGGTMQGKIAMDGDDLYHEACFESVRTLPKCAGCEKAIKGEHLIVQGKSYHKDCFTCIMCRTSIVKKFSPQDDGTFMCPSCADLSRRPEAISMKLVTKFRQFDTNGDGSISLEELRLILLAVGMAEADIPSIFAGADVNGDGKIDYGEFFTWLCGDINQVISEKIMKWEIAAAKPKPKPVEQPAKPPPKPVGQVKSGDMILDIPDPTDMTQDEKKKAVNGILDVLLSKPIPFKRNKSDLMLEAYEVINEIASLLKVYSDQEILAEGHAAGKPHENTPFHMNLSKARAKAVKTALVESGAVNGLWSAGVGSAAGKGMKVIMCAIDPDAARKRLELTPNFAPTPGMPKEQEIEMLNCELKKVFEVNETLMFEMNKAVWKEDCTTTIREVARVLKAFSHMAVVIEVSTTGDMDSNDQMRIKLSGQRADMVTAALKKEGVGNPLKPIGLGCKEGQGSQVRIRVSISGG